MIELAALLVIIVCAPAALVLVGCALICLLQVLLAPFALLAHLFEQAGKARSWPTNEAVMWGVLALTLLAGLVGAWV